MILPPRYQARELLGEGGYGQVYRAWDSSLEREVAVKVLHQSSPDPEALRRFELEGRFLATLQHPHILTVYEAGIDSGHAFLVTELLPGMSLADEVGNAKRGEAWLRQRLRDAFEGLEACHEAGVTHRDIKPENLFLRQDGTLVLGDFGIAKLMHAKGPTQTGFLVGTPRYMAPEIFLGKEPSPESDFYSLGVSFLELAYGAPIEFPEALSEGLRRLETEPDLGRFFSRPPLFPNLAGELLQATSLRPGPRRDRLRRLLGEGAVTGGKRESLSQAPTRVLDPVSPEASLPSSKRRPWGLVGLGFLGLVGVGFLLSSTPEPAGRGPHPGASVAEEESPSPPKPSEFEQRIGRWEARISKFLPDSKTQRMLLSHHTFLSQYAHETRPRGEWFLSEILDLQGTFLNIVQGLVRRGNSSDRARLVPAFGPWYFLLRSQLEVVGELERGKFDQILFQRKSPGLDLRKKIEKLARDLEKHRGSLSQAEAEEFDRLFGLSQFLFWSLDANQIADAAESHAKRAMTPDEAILFHETLGSLVRSWIFRKFTDMGTLDERGSLKVFLSRQALRLQELLAAGDSGAEVWMIRGNFVRILNIRKRLEGTEKPLDPELVELALDALAEKPWGEPEVFTRSLDYVYLELDREEGDAFLLRNRPELGSTLPEFYARAIRLRRVFHRRWRELRATFPPENP